VGGTQKNLQGTLLFLRVKERRVAETVARLNAIGMGKHMVVMFSGNMTKKQREKVKEKCKFRVSKMQEAMKWLCENHKAWKNVDYQALEREAANFVPIIVDNSTEVEDSTDTQHANTEETESFSCFFPDGATTTTSGGLDSPEEFKAFVEESKKQGFDVEFQFETERKLVFEADGDNLEAACLLQFPFGVGGFNELRWKADRSLSTRFNPQELIEHWSLIAKNEFHNQHFVLVLFNLFIRQQLFRTARFQLRGETSAKALANGLRIEDFTAQPGFDKTT